MISSYKVLYKRIIYINKRREHASFINKVDVNVQLIKNDHILLFAILRNESLRLPYFIEYYKSLGVDHFFLLDNDSTDNTIEIASKIDNVNIFKTKDKYQNHWYWMEYLLQKYGRDHWCLVVDIDELLCFPHTEALSIRQLCNYLDQNAQTALRSFLLDMYSGKQIDIAEYQPGSNPLEVVDHFDKDYIELEFMFPDRIRFKPYSFPIFTGGMRDRVFGKSRPPSILSKVSLFKNVKGTYLSQGMHAINGAVLSDLQGVVFHTKFLSDFILEVEEECNREQHYGNAFYYKRFQKTLREQPSLSFYHAGSIKYRDNQQLVEIGLMKSDPAFEKYVQQVSGLAV
ncbi:glycosyltransferase family 2 protein [Telluribacter humicola]|uniref:glycosyltransferase family 2 protein n=1 Tax=Telluribacter humicola TaxID=1720261 RepID=UPI001A9566CF|nr:glycosyltransferase family 2 protein [Telluribacter humicola]